MVGEPRGSWTKAIEQRSGPAYWRALDELLDTPEFREAMHREFPAGAAEFGDGLSRRNFVKLLGASVALAGMGGCIGEPTEPILPYVTQPPEVTPGRARYYATSMVLDGFATGLLAESHVGRPTKLEGNPDHPASLGAAGVHEQASVLQLYDPARARRVRRRGRRSTWTDLVQSVRPEVIRRTIGVRGTGLRFLLEPTSSPAFAALIAQVRELYPEAQFHFYAPLATRWGAAADPTHPIYDFRDADVVVALDADFLGTMPFHLRYARQFAERRGPSGGEMNRLYAVEPGLSITGAMADHRLRVRAGEIQRLTAALLAAVAPGGDARGTPHHEWLTAVAEDLGAHARRSVVIAGPRQPSAVHALAHALNAMLGNVGRTVRYIASPLLGAGDSDTSLAALGDAIDAGDVQYLAVLGGNPSYATPADVEFPARLRAVPHTVYLGLHENETARDCEWVVPGLHFLETWGDACACDGTVSFIQPMIAPLYDGRDPSELLTAFLGAPRSAHELLRDYWRQRSDGDFGEFWDRALGLGFLPDTAAPSVSAPAWAIPRPSARAAPGAGSGGLEVVFAPDASVYDGRFANNAWLQELPDPLTKLTWDNAALLSPATALRLGIETGDVVALGYRGRQLRAPAFVLPGHADESVTLHFGYGRDGGEAVARGVGVNAYRLWTSDTGYAGAGLELERVLEGGGPVRYPLATTQAHWTMEGRPIVLQATLDEYRRNPEFTSDHRGRQLSLYEPFRYEGNQWAMAIDLSLCTGCSACVVACQAENNIPVVGKDGVLNSREMHWLRIDRYYTGEPDDPGVVTQPMLCQHCEKAPCEYVCPVNATVHSPDGLNEMVYNRCIGTRFCSNNCPYKVRRFNWFDYNAEIAETVAMAKNPDVTVRARGVMEKCTFCVQRIRAAEIDARIDGRSTGPGEVVTACQQACPTRAIVFGSLDDEDSELARRRAEPRAYAVLNELGTEPRVRYLARITNPNPAADAADAHVG